MADKFKACSVSGCKGNADRSKEGRKGFCDNHYRRFKRYGDPLAGRASPGEPQKFFNNIVLKYEGNECLIWPFTRIPGGYGQLWVEGKNETVTRLICKEVYGPPPFEEYQAAHSCGNGHLGCVTKKHLEWKTPAANQADRLIHGTHARGERSKLSKLKSQQVLQIISLTGKEAQGTTARRYGVSRSCVGQIQRRESWAWLHE